MRTDTITNTPLSINKAETDNDKSIKNINFHKIALKIDQIYIMRMRIAYVSIVWCICVVFFTPNLKAKQICIMQMY